MNTYPADPSYRTVRTVTEPTFEPLTLADAKTFLREPGTDQDDLITALIAAVRAAGENYTRRAFCTQELELTMDCFPLDMTIALPRPPLQSVEWIKYIDAGGAPQTVDPSEYQVDTAMEPGRVKPTYGNYWKVVRASDFNAVQIRYWAGYGPGSPQNDPNIVPHAIRQWMRQRVAQLYEHREAIVIERGSLLQIPRDYTDALIDRYIVSLFK